MAKTNKKIGPEVFISRPLSFTQLTKISNDNRGVLNRNIDLTPFDIEDIFVLTPVLIHYHAFGVEVQPHLRTIVTKLDESNLLAFQDITFDQWEQVRIVSKMAS